eukprot:COSAG06_NODE_19352_length_842_cov_1.546433_2_plen_87_part_01
MIPALPVHQQQHVHLVPKLLPRQLQPSADPVRQRRHGGRQSLALSALRAASQAQPRPAMDPLLRLPPLHLRMHPGQRLRCTEGLRIP